MIKQVKKCSIKIRFLNAVVSGELGEVNEQGYVVTLKQFKAHFSDIKTDYINSFLPAATIEPGLSSASHTKYLFRIRNGVYRVHEDAIKQFVESRVIDGDGVKEARGCYEI